MLAVVTVFTAPAITSAADPLVPGQVEITEIVRSSGMITLHWRITGPGGAATDIKYRINGSAFAVGSTASPVNITLDENSNPLVNNTLYDVQLIGSNGNGDGVPSVEFTVAPGTGRVAAPRITAITPGDRLLKVDYAQDFNGFETIEYSTDNGTTWYGPIAITSTSNTFNITVLSSNSSQMLANGATYQIRLRGWDTNGYGTSGMSAAVAGTPSTIPSPPEVTSVEARANSIVVTAELGLTGGSAVNKIEYSTDNGTNWTNVVPIPATLSGKLNIPGSLFSFTITNESDTGTRISAGKSYTVVVRTWNVNGESRNSNATTVTGTPNSAPSQPEITSVEPRGNSIAVVAELGLAGSAAVNKIEYSTDNGSKWTNVLPLPASSAGRIGFTITNESGTTTRIAAGKTYTVVLRVSNIHGTSGNSNAVEAATVGANELSPAVIDSILARGTMLIVRGTLPTLQTGVSVLRVEYSTDDGATWRSTGQRTGSFNVSSLSSSAPVVAGAEYLVRIRMVTTSGTSPASSAYPVRAGSVPAPVTITSASVTVDGLRIVGAVGADNGAPLVRLEYSTDNGSSWFVAPFQVGGSGSTSPTTVATTSTTVATTSTTVASSSTTVASTVTTVAPSNTATPTTTVAPVVSRNFDFTVTAVSSNGRDPIAVGVRYIVRVRAVSSVGIGAPSAAKVASAARTASAPTIKEVLAETGSFSVDSVLGPTNGSSVTDVEYSTDDGATWASTGQTTGNFTITSPSNDPDSPLAGNRFYEIRVRVVTANGTGASSVPFTKKALSKTHKITFPQPQDRVIGDAPFLIAVSANSKLPVTVTSNTPAVCTSTNSMMGAARATITVLAPGTCTLVATRGPSGSFPAAAPVSRSFTVRTKPELGATSPLRVRDAAKLAGLTVGPKSAVSAASLTPEICGVAKRSIVAKATGTCKVAVTVKPAKGKAATKNITLDVVG